MPEYDRKAMLTELDGVNKGRSNALFLIDRSYSMQGDRNKGANDAFEYFFNVCQADRKAMSRTDVCVIEFGDESRVALDWTSIMQVDPKILASHDADMGTTDYEAAIETCLQKADEKRDWNRSNGFERTPSRVYFITDGEPTVSIDRSVAEINRRRQEKDGAGTSKFWFLPIYIGDPDDRALEILGRYNKQVCVVDPDNPMALKELFSWIHRSEHKLSESKPGEKVVSEVPPSNTGVTFVQLN